VCGRLNLVGPDMWMTGWRKEEGVVQHIIITTEFDDSMGVRHLLYGPTWSLINHAASCTNS